MQERFRGYLVIGGGKTVGAGIADGAITLFELGGRECIEWPWRQLQDGSPGRSSGVGQLQCDGQVPIYVDTTVIVDVIFARNNGG
jgi:hypothetical protein